MSIEEKRKKRLMLALGILSGRLLESNISTFDMDTIGLDYYQCKEYGWPDQDWYRSWAEDVVFQAINGWQDGGEDD